MCGKQEVFKKCRLETIQGTRSPGTRSPCSSLPGLSCSRPSHRWLPGPPAESFMLLAQPWLQIAGCSPDSGPGIQPPSLTRRAPACPYLCPLQSGPPASICSRRHTACSLHHSEMSVEHLYMLSTVPKASPCRTELAGWLRRQSSVSLRNRKARVQMQFSGCGVQGRPGSVA